MAKKTIHIIGAGPGGLTAAINLAKAGFPVVVHEKNPEVGSRFNGDFQGIENWSTREDARAFFERHGLTINFLFAPYSQGVFFNHDLQEVKIKTNRPLFYLIERGAAEHSLDQGLKRQAQEAGGEFVWNDNVLKLPDKTTIVATGPKAADIIAQGILFNTDHPDGYYGFLDDRIAPKGYAYLLVNGGKATFATCMFEDFRNSNLYFERALMILKQVLKIDIRAPRPFGGFGNFFLPGTPSGKNPKGLYVGEAAGSQDALWGFGIRYAILSGFLAAQSIIWNASYQELIQKHILPLQKVSLANRLLYDLAGNRGRKFLLNKLGNASDVSAVLYRHHRLGLGRKFLFMVAKRWYHTRLINKNCLHENCSCVWCRCAREQVESEQKTILATRG